MFYSIVQIGAFIGNDDVYKMLMEQPQCNAILVEPVPWFFDTLKRNYWGIKNPSRIVFDNSVINTYDGECDFHCMKEDVKYKFNYNTEIDWGKEISSLRLNIIKEHEMFLDNCQFQYDTLKLNCISPTSFVKKHNITSLEYLKIDTEGFDFEILTNWPFNLAMPKYIKFETTHLDGSVNKFSRYTELDNLLGRYDFKYLKTENRDAIYVR
jgi:FkbM family methyltransferase